MAQSDTAVGEAARIRERLARLDTERTELETRLAQLTNSTSMQPARACPSGTVTNRSPTSDKISLFRTLFGGREDVYPRRWENAAKGKAGYGHLIVDECHHLSAVSFEKVARRAKSKYVLGLSATVTRPDGHHPIVFMQCGPVRFRASAKSLARLRPFTHRALLRTTAFRLPDDIAEERPPIQQVYAALAEDEARNDLIFDDALKALEAGRSPLVLTARKEHARRLVERLGRFARNVLFLRGGMGAQQRRSVMQRLEEIPDAEERILVATGRYVGKGFDDARLDTLFLAMPVAWRGSLAQYVGRLHRLHPAKREVLVYDYVDEAVPALRRMAQKRIRGYCSLGYSVERPDGESAV